VPILADVRERAGREGDPGRLQTLVDRVATALFWTVFLVSVVGAAAAPVLVWLMASGLARDPDTFAVATNLTRWMFPYILFVSLVALAAGILNTWRRFMVPAFAPVLLNLCFIGAALLLTPLFDPPIYALAAGVVAGGIAQLAIQVPALRRIGVLPRIGLGLRAAFSDPDTRRILKLMAPAVLAVSVAQLSLVINTHIASLLAEGSVSWVSFGDRLMEFPTALLGVALGTVLLPSLSKARAEQDTERYNEMLDWGLRLSVLLAIPCMIGLAVLAEPLTALLFHYGRFTADDVEMTRRAVLGYSVGLLGLIAVKVLAPGFYAQLDVRTPVKIAVSVLALTQMMNIVFVPLFAHAGLALSISIGASLNALLLLAGLRRRRSYTPRPGWPRFVLQVGLAAGTMAVLLLWVEPRFDWIALRATPLLRVGLVLGLVAAGAAVYLAALLAVGIRPRQFLRREEA
jgi:putative peptidoglycan lipid II flippase